MWMWFSVKYMYTGVKFGMVTVMCVVGGVGVE